MFQSLRSLIARFNKFFVTFILVVIYIWPMFLFLNVISALEGTLKDLLLFLHSVVHVF